MFYNDDAGIAGLMGRCRLNVVQKSNAESCLSVVCVCSGGTERTTKEKEKEMSYVIKYSAIEALGKFMLSYRLNIWQSKPPHYSTYSYTYKRGSLLVRARKLEYILMR